MDRLQLASPTPEHAAQIAAYRDEFLRWGESMDGTSDLQRFEDPLQWISWANLLATNAARDHGLVPVRQFLCLREADGRLVGMIDVRLALNDYLRHFAGHIGYSIRRSERGKGYAKIQLRLALDRCREFGLERVLLTCHRDNAASRRVIESAGGHFEAEEVDPSDGAPIRRYWLDVSKNG